MFSSVSKPIPKYHTNVLNIYFQIQECLQNETMSYQVSSLSLTKFWSLRFLFVHSISHEEEVKLRQQKHVGNKKKVSI